jgi:hypothetical protein
MSGAARHLVLACLLATPGAAGELRNDTLLGFERYVRATDTRLDAEASGEIPFLYFDRLPAAEQANSDAALARGELIYRRIETRDGAGRAIEAPHGIIHHWIGAMFLAGSTLDEVVAVVRDYDRHREYYSGDVIASKTIERDGDDFWVYLQFRKKKVVTVVLNTEHDARYLRLGPCRVFCRAESVHIGEVEDPGTPREREKAPDDQTGFLWRINSYWRFEERAGGVVIECESISLTRDIPLAVRWIVSPFVTSVPIESLRTTLEKTREAVARRAAARPPTGK